MAQSSELRTFWKVVTWDDYFIEDDRGGSSLGTALTTVNHFSDGKNIVFCNEPVDSGLPKLGAFIGDEVRIGADDTGAGNSSSAGSFIEIIFPAWLGSNNQKGA